VDVMMQAFRRSAYSVVLWRLADRTASRASRPSSPPTRG
jgi:hypothetical protein